MFDAVIVGGGPAGLVAALDLSRAGLHVVVLEPRRAPIDKACAEGIMPAGVAELERLGIRPAGVTLRGITYRDGKRSISARFPHGPALGVRRTELHRRLRAAVTRAGIEVRRHKLGEIHPRTRSVAADGVTARFLIGADGLHSTVRRQAGLRRADPRGTGKRYGVHAHFRTEPWSDHVQVYWGQGGTEAYVTPVGARCVGVAMLGTRGRTFADRLAEFPALAARLPDAPVRRARGAGPLRQAVRSVAAGRVLLVGDAAGYLDALTGEGLAIAFTCARALADCLREDRPEAYVGEHRRITLRYRLLTAGLLSVAQRPAARRLIVPTAARFPSLFRLAVAQLAR